MYPATSEQAAKELFTEINKAEPVVLVDMPEIGASDDENALISEAAEALRQRYPNMFKASRTCRPPHVNLDVLRNQMCCAPRRLLL